VFQNKLCDIIPPITNESENAQVERCLHARSADCWRNSLALFQRVIASTILKQVRLIGFERERIEDLIQEVYVRLCAHECRILREAKAKTAASVFGLVQAVAITAVLDNYRSHRATKRGGRAAIVSLEDFHPAPAAQDLDRDILIGQIDSILKKYSEKATEQRDCQVFWLYYQHGFTAKDISGLPGIGLSSKGVESLVYRLTAEVRRQILPPDNSKGSGA
jgi:RNA polymerase sigma-70 factor (ECF subfamily)